MVGILWTNGHRPLSCSSTTIACSFGSSLHCLGARLGLMERIKAFCHSTHNTHAHTSHTRHTHTHTCTHNSLCSYGSCLLSNRLVRWVLAIGAFAIVVSDLSHRPHLHQAVLREVTRLYSLGTSTVNQERTNMRSLLSNLSSNITWKHLWGYKENSSLQMPVTL